MYTRPRQRISLASDLRLARWRYALLRWESAVVIALTIVGVPLAINLAALGSVPENAWICVLIFGSVAETALVTSSLTDAQIRSAAVRPVLEFRLRVSELDDRQTKERMQMAVDYRIRLQDVLNDHRTSGAVGLSPTVTQLDGLLAGMARLATRLNRLQKEASMQSRDKSALTARITELEAQLLAEDDASLHSQLRETVSSRQRQLRKTEEMERLMKRATLRLEDALGALATLHTQITIYAARGMKSEDASRLADEINDETRKVDALLRALDRVYRSESQDQ